MNAFEVMQALLDGKKIRNVYRQNKSPLGKHVLFLYEHDGKLKDSNDQPVCGIDINTKGWEVVP